MIIGCGFGGLEAARALRDADVSITLVDKTNPSHTALARYMASESTTWGKVVRERKISAE